MTDRMRAMTLDAPGRALRLTDLPIPTPGPGQVRIRVAACGVCRTDLHVVDGDLPDVPAGIVPGHEIVGRIDALGPGVADFRPGDRVGAPWLGHVCGVCPYCRGGRENLCDAPGFTGYTLAGGYAEYCVVDARFVLTLPPGYDDAHAAPLLCAGLIGYRAWAMALDLAPGARRIGLYGFGAAAHIVAQIAAAKGLEIYAFVRPGDAAAAAFARELGAVWSGASDTAPPEPLDAAILFAPVGALVPLALQALRKGGAVIAAGIHMSDIPSFPYVDLWQERSIKSVANLTRADGVAFMDLAGRTPLTTHVTTYPLAEANRALADLRNGRLTGAAVLAI